MTSSTSLAQEVLEHALARGYHYEIRDGEVVVIGRRGHPLKLFERSGYLQFGVPYQGRSRNAFVHRLVARVKFGEAIYQPGVEVRHLDGNSYNNLPYNIALGSRRANILDRPKASRVESARIASRAGASKGGRARRKLTPDQVVSLRAERAQGATYAVLMEKYGLSKSGVAGIVKKRRY